MPGSAGSMRTNVIAVLFAAAWVGLLFTGGISLNTATGLGIVALAYLVTCAALVLMLRSRAAPHPLVTVICLVPASIFTFTVYAMLLDATPLDLLRADSDELKTFGTLLPGLVATLGTTLLMLLPTAALFRRTAWLPPVLALVYWIALTRQLPVIGAGGTAGERITAIEQLCLGVAVPVLLATFGGLTRKALSPR